MIYVEGGRTGARVGVRERRPRAGGWRSYTQRSGKCFPELRGEGGPGSVSRTPGKLGRDRIGAAPFPDVDGVGQQVGKLPGLVGDVVGRPSHMRPTGAHDGVFRGTGDSVRRAVVRSEEHTSELQSRE